MQQERWHTVKQGEWLSKIAAQYGIADWKVIWSHPNNANLTKRRDPNILFPGDLVFVPATKAKEAVGSTNKRHRFVLKRYNDFFELTLRYPDATPIKDQQYVLNITDPPLKGVTDGNGHFKHEHLNPAKLHSGLLELPDLNLSFQIDLGVLNPAEKKSLSDNAEYDDGLSGIQMRLANLGYDPGSLDGRLENGQVPQVTCQAIALFQANEMQLPLDKITGELDDDTRKAIIDKHKS
jgi:N-acetylmuramoyl-L-alanine amidase